MVLVGGVLVHSQDVKQILEKRAVKPASFGVPMAEADCTCTTTRLPQQSDASTSDLLKSGRRPRPCCSTTGRPHHNVGRRPLPQVAVQTRVDGLNSAADAARWRRSQFKLVATHRPAIRCRVSETGAYPRATACDAVRADLS